MKAKRYSKLEVDEHGNWITGDPKFDAKYIIVGADTDLIWYNKRNPAAPNQPISLIEALKKNTN